MYKNETLDYLNSLQRFGWKLGLETILQLLDRLANPHKTFRSVHVAGTNGKGSTAAMLESILRSSGYKTGMYTSPHLVNVEERIRVAGEMIPWEKLAGYVSDLRPHLNELKATYFEALTAVAFKYFADNRIDIAVVEVGLGGRFDATNVIEPVLSVITSLDFDHTEHLGKTIGDIAGEKAGIIKTGVPCLAQQQPEEAAKVLRQTCVTKAAELYWAQDASHVENIRLFPEHSLVDLRLGAEWVRNIKVGLAGNVQIKNVALAAVAARLVAECGFPRATTAKISAGLAAVNWPARLQKVGSNPDVVLDVSHNPAGVQALLNDLREAFSFQKLHVIVGLLADKDYRQIAKLISSAADEILVVTPDSDRGLEADLLSREFNALGREVHIVADFQKEFDRLVEKASPEDLICITGSHYVAGQFISFYKKS